MNDLSPSILFQRQAVQPPYFAFTRVCSTDRGVTATFTPEHPMEYEAGVIAAAEAGRHLAILGACAAAAKADDDKKLYYLATTALLSRTAFWPGHASELQASAEVIEVTRRELIATGKILAPHPIYTLRCSYQILSDRMFDRIFAAYRQPHLIQSVQSPYSKSIPIDDITPIEGGLAATVGPLHPSACAGHFPNLPAWPVALVMHTLSRLAGYALQRLVRRQCSYSVVQAEVSAEHLAFADQQLSLCVTHESPIQQPTHYALHCIASIDQHTVAIMQLILETTD